jgi:hypothetical protein
MSEADDEPKNFTVRFSPEAQFNAITIAHDHMERYTDLRGGRALYNELITAAGKLAFLPERNAVHQEVSSQMGRTLRRLLVRRWNLYYEVIPDSQDGPLVKIIFIRDSRLLPLTPDEVGSIQANQ